MFADGFPRFHLAVDTLALGYSLPAIWVDWGLAPVECSCRAYQKKRMCLFWHILFIVCNSSSLHSVNTDLNSGKSENYGTNGKSESYANCANSVLQGNSSRGRWLSAKPKAGSSVSQSEPFRHCCQTPWLFAPPCWHNSLSWQRMPRQAKTLVSSLIPPFFND